MSRKPGGLILKDPSAIEPQGFDWTAWLAELGALVTIATSTYTVSPAGLTLSGVTIVPGSLKTQVTLAGGTLGVRYTVTNHVVTSTAVEDDRQFYVKIENR